MNVEFLIKEMNNFNMLTIIGLDGENNFRGFRSGINYKKQ